jgi:hypothetical protein
MNEFEIVLPRHVPRNPEPKIYLGGDCGACVLSALTNIPVAEIYAIARDDKKVSPFGLQNMISALNTLGRQYFYHHITTFPNWINEVYRWPFGFSACQMNLAWFDYVRVAIEAGYYGICEVNMRGEGDLNGRGCETDHWVLLCGVRITKHPATIPGAFMLDDEVLIRDSSRTMPAERWMESSDFLIRHGGFQTILVKPK